MKHMKKMLEMEAVYLINVKHTQTDWFQVVENSNTALNGALNRRKTGVYC